LKISISNCETNKYLTLTLTLTLTTYIGRQKITAFREKLESLKKKLEFFTQQELFIRFKKQKYNAEKLEKYGILRNMSDFEILELILILFLGLKRYELAQEISFFLLLR
jgi:hypothetical protein